MPFFGGLIVLLSAKQIGKNLQSQIHACFFRLMESCTNDGILHSSHCMGLTQTQKLRLPLLELIPPALGLDVNISASAPQKL